MGWLSSLKCYRSDPRGNSLVSIPTFGERVLQARLMKGALRGKPVSQQEVADAMGVTNVTVGRWEADLKEPSLETIERLAKVLNVNVGWLGFGIGDSRVGDTSHVDTQPGYKRLAEQMGGQVAEGAPTRPNPAPAKKRATAGRKRRKR